MRFSPKIDARVALMMGVMGCSRHPASCLARPSSSPVAASSAEVAKILLVELPPEDAGDAAEADAFIELVRRDAWDEAAASIEALPETKQKKATVRLVKGRVAMARGEYAAAVQAFDGLEKDLAPIADDIEKWRAESQAQAGPFAPAAQYYSKQGGAKALARAALAFHKANMDAEARAAADRAIALGKGDASDVPLRVLRAELAEAAGQTSVAAEDLRFIAVRAPASDEAKAATAALATVDPQHPLTGKERLARAERFVEAGRTDEALDEIAKAERAPGPPDDDDAGWGRALALYKSRGRYEKAAQIFARLAQKPGRRQAEALYYAARAQSRADHDEEAKSGYRAVLARFPASPWADESAYLAARLSFLHAAWGEAAAGYTAYLRKFPNGKQRESAAYERALSLLANGKFASARSELHGLVQATTSAGEAARLRELEAIAAAKMGDKEAALSMWGDVIRTQPLSWAAIAARARLAREGAEAPPAIDPADAKVSEAITFRLPPVALLYHRLGLDGDAETYLRAHEREAVLDMKGREKEGLCRMYAELGRAARLYRIGIEGVPSALLARAPSPASEWAWRCVYPQPYPQQVSEVEAREALPRGFVHAVMRQESAFDPEAVSRARAVGLLQLMPDTARRLAAETGIDFDERVLRTPSVNIDIGGRYLAKLLRSFDGSVPAAAAAYNAGPRAVRRWLARMKALELDLWVAMIPFEETRVYVARVMSNLARYAYLGEGESAVPEVALSLPASSAGAQDDAADY